MTSEMQNKKATRHALAINFLYLCINIIYGAQNANMCTSLDGNNF